MVQDSSGRSVVASVQEFRSTEPDREPALWAAATVAVGNSDITGVSVTLRPGFKVTARVEFDPSAQKPAERDLMAFRLEVEPADGRRIGFPSAYSAQLANTLTLMPGRYLIRCDNAPKGWTVKSAIVSGRDVCDVPLSVENADVDNIVVTLTDRPSTLFGIVRDDKGQPDDMATVLVFPSDGNWTDLGLNPRRLRSVRSSRTGTFSFWGFPPGDYFIVAVSDSVTTDWQDPAFLQRLTRVATRLTLTAGQPLSQTLTTARGITR
jgi:hypothetical protein